MPGIFQSLQDMDEKRINNFKNLLKKSVETERSVFPIINKCLDGIISAADSIDEKNVSHYCYYYDLEILLGIMDTWM